jgi:hypothetical protein
MYLPRSANYEVPRYVILSSVLLVEAICVQTPRFPELINNINDLSGCRVTSL